MSLILEGGRKKQLVDKVNPLVSQCESGATSIAIIFDTHAQLEKWITASTRSFLNSSILPLSCWLLVIAGAE